MAFSSHFSLSKIEEVIQTISLAEKDCVISDAKMIQSSFSAIINHIGMKVFVWMKNALSWGNTWERNRLFSSIFDHTSCIPVLKTHGSCWYSVRRFEQRVLQEQILSIFCERKGSINCCKKNCSNFQTNFWREEVLKYYNTNDVRWQTHLKQSTLLTTRT